MSSCLGFARSLSPAMLSCLLEAVSLSQRCWLSSGLRRLVYVVLVCLGSTLSLLLGLLLHQRPLPSALLRSCPRHLVVEVGPSVAGGALVHVRRVGIATGTGTPRLIASRSSWTCGVACSPSLLVLVLPLRDPPRPTTPSRTLQGLGASLPPLALL
jgi:hypothetical protein